MEAEKYPAWLADKVLHTSFNWKTAVKTSMQELLALITLHDSYWYNTFIEDGNSWILVIKLDAFWNKAFCHNLEDRPFLVIKFQQVVCLFQNFGEYDNDYRIIGSAGAEVVNSARFIEWMNFGQVAGLFSPDTVAKDVLVKSLTRTEIVTIYSGLLSLVHAPAIEVLLYSEQGRQLAVNLSARE